MYTYCIESVKLQTHLANIQDYSPLSTTVRCSIFRKRQFIDNATINNPNVPIIQYNYF